MNSIKTGNFLTSWATVGFSRRIFSILLVNCQSCPCPEVLMVCMWFVTFLARIYLHCVWWSSIVSGVSVIAIFRIVREVAEDSCLIQVLQGHKSGGMDCGATALILLFMFFFPSSCAESTYSHVTETSLKCFLLVIFTNIHLPSLYIMYFIVVWCVYKSYVSYKHVSSCI